MPILGICASQVTGHLFNPTGSFEAIQTYTVDSGGASSITFSSIPQTYTHLQIRGIVRSNRGVSLDSLGVRMNGDAGNNYSIHELLGTGAAASAQGQTSVPALYAANGVPTAASTANIFESFVFDIFDYSLNTKYKTTRALSGSDLNGSGTIYLSSGSWMNTAAITSLSMGHFGTSSNMVQYSQIALYGIKGA